MTYGDAMGSFQKTRDGLRDEGKDDSRLLKIVTAMSHRGLFIRGNDFKVCVVRRSWVSSSVSVVDWTSFLSEVTVSFTHVKRVSTTKSL